MRGLITAIRNVLRAMRRAASRWTEKWIEVGGKLVRQLVPTGVPIEADEPEAVEATPREDLFSFHLRTAASQMIADGTPNPDLLAELPEHIVRWLAACDDGMLRSIARASDREIHDHVSARKGLRGVMWSDKQSVDEYVRSLIEDPVSHDDEVEYDRAWVPA